MNLLKVATASFISLVSIVVLQPTGINAKSVDSYTNNKVIKVQKAPIKVGPIVPMNYDDIKVIPLITEENDPRNKEVNDSEDIEEKSEYYYTEDDPMENQYEGELDSEGRHWGWHYDSDDMGEYGKDLNGHYGYHYDDDVQPNKKEHRGHHHNHKH